ncbi:hypothetical protein WA026_013079 [Henosepilachna vigintioctopunctata]|uniref:Uncharacterized protein n=1 Tax=Henosepilachna vigintioctopunctata TaxID=420089 RepID=A0AAW1UKZ7_9CUCU
MIQITIDMLPHSFSIRKEDLLLLIIHILFKIGTGEVMVRWHVSLSISLRWNATFT